MRSRQSLYAGRSWQMTAVAERTRHRPTSETYILLASTLLALLGIFTFFRARLGMEDPDALAAREPDAGVSVAAASEVESSDGVIEVITYQVKSGDTLSTIAAEFGTSVSSISYINGITSPDRIAIGQSLSLITNASGVVVTVSKGDTLSSLVDRYGVPMNVIIQVNKITNPDALYLGQTLILPGATVSGRPVSSVSRMSSLRWPVQGRVTSAFGWRTQPVTKKSELHQGIDIAAPSGRAVTSAAAGKVTFSGWISGYGNLVTVDHGSGIVTKYAHLSKRSVATGTSVSAGQTIGLVGSTGLSTGPHLHFEVRSDSDPVNPRSYLP